jgi:hypothetical protein
LQPVQPPGGCEAAIGLQSASSSCCSKKVPFGLMQLELLKQLSSGAPHCAFASWQLQALQTVGDGCAK